MVLCLQSSYGSESTVVMCVYVCMANYSWSGYFLMHDFSHATAGAKVANKKEQVVNDRVKKTAKVGSLGKRMARNSPCVIFTSIQT